jgi:hypothetical protein
VNLETVENYPKYYNARKNLFYKAWNKSFCTNFFNKIKLFFFNCGQI